MMKKRVLRGFKLKLRGLYWLVERSFFRIGWEDVRFLLADVWTDFCFLFLDVLDDWFEFEFFE